MRPLVTVIIRAYNQESVIGKAIESVLSQTTNFNFRILIGEDSSTVDSTRKICEAYARNFPGKVEIMPRSSNKGNVKNLFDCLAAVDTEFVAICDGDDYWINPNKLQRQVSFLNNHDDHVLVHCDMKVLDEEGNISDMFRHDVPSGDLSRIIFTRHIINTSTALFRTNVLKDVNYQRWLSDGVKIDDTTLWVYIAQFGLIAHESVLDVVYRSYEESISHSSSLAKRLDYIHRVYYVLYYLHGQLELEFDRRLIAQLHEEDVAWAILSSRKVVSILKNLPDIGILRLLRTMILYPFGRHLDKRKDIQTAIVGA